MFGMPSVTNIGQGSSPTGGCVPPSYTLGVPYLTDGGCPTNYFAACSTGTSYADHSADYIWCCPSVEGWHFNCAPATDTGAAPYGCQATFDSGDIITGSRTDLIKHTGQAETHTIGGDRGVNAWGIALLLTPAPSTSTVAIMTTTSPSGSTIRTVGSASASAGISPAPTPTSSSQGLSTGAAAGIGAGVGVAVLAILGFLIFWLLRRKYKSKQPQQEQHQQQQPLPQSYQASYQNSYHTSSELGQYGPGFYATTMPKHTSTPPNVETARLGVPSELSPDGSRAGLQEMQG
ncbi:hypothetical protein O1611_g5185 [Lasiodiplodia mahajangana]|uniref:Uncharacterized protein n=1 Tax=Lasiodiplodia mahajangana TaxID=1108764 RepID=A0ACC2JLS2_9PEZI|nr:hypothetical protein O1611_g5185 [Lasiodiplodia mahajangana]